MRILSRRHRQPMVSASSTAAITIRRTSRLPMGPPSRQREGGYQERQRDGRNCQAEINVGHAAPHFWDTGGAANISGENLFRTRVKGTNSRQRGDGRRLQALRRRRRNVGIAQVRSVSPLASSIGSSNFSDQDMGRSTQNTQIPSKHRGSLRNCESRTPAADRRTLGPRNVCVTVS
jgi:hypothetical protein